jgi:hypothetical protein
MTGLSVFSKTSSCVENAVNTLSNLVYRVLTCLDPWPLMTVTLLSFVLAVTTGRVPCFFSRSLKGRSRTTTCTDDPPPLVEERDKESEDNSRGMVSSVMCFLQRATFQTQIVNHNGADSRVFDVDVDGMGLTGLDWTGQPLCTAMDSIQRQNKPYTQIVFACLHEFCLY